MVQSSRMNPSVESNEHPIIQGPLTKVSRMFDANTLVGERDVRLDYRDEITCSRRINLECFSKHAIPHDPKPGWWRGSCLSETSGVNMLAKETLEWITIMRGETNDLPHGPQTPSYCEPHYKQPQPPPKRASSLSGSSRGYNCLIPISSLGRKAKID
jgi:hypothetical protein